MSARDKNAFRGPECKGVYRAIYQRRDIRREFLPKPVPKQVLMKILDAAHHAGSVGFMQPWNFIVIRDRKTKERVKKIFASENAAASRNYRGTRRKKYLSMKLEGIVEAPVNIGVTCDSSRKGPHVLGRNTILETDIFSTCCAIQNLWLAARAEGIGMGWVSILDNGRVKRALKIPPRIKLVAYLCLGYVSGFPKRPMLESEGWEKRLPLKKMVFWENWNGRQARNGVR